MCTPIPTYVINLESRTDRREHIIAQFQGRDEFDVQIVNAHIHEFGNVGLWQTICQIVSESILQKHDYILICEDDHMFTGKYESGMLHEMISEASALGADALSGGVSWHEDAVEVSGHLFWVRRFTGTQFVIVFRKFFQTILDVTFTPDDCADARMCDHSNHIYFIDPFISVQKEFGYSDATTRNNGTARVEPLFSASAMHSRIKRSIRSFYRMPELSTENTGTDGGSVPVYVINLPERADRRVHILEQFEGRPEFDVSLVEACRHEVGALGLWMSIRKIVQLAMENEDDVIVICEDDHVFTPHYSSHSFMLRVLLAHQLGCDYVSGGSGRVDMAVPLGNNLFWTSHCLSAQFIVIYRKFFAQILAAPYDENVIGDIHLSQLTANKMVMFPFISLQKDFGYSDVTPLHNAKEGIVQMMFQMTESRMKCLHDVFERHYKVAKRG